MKEIVFNSEIHFKGKSCDKGHDGYRYKSTKACWQCAASYDRKAYLKVYNKERRTKVSSLATCLYLAAKSRQKKKNPIAPFDITKEWVEEKIKAGLCEATGIEFSLSLTDTLKRPFSPSIDKKDSKGFYTKENCQVVCFIYNVCKSEFTHDDVMIMVKALQVKS